MVTKKSSEYLHSALPGDVQIGAVITGDIVRSTGYSVAQREKIRSAIPSIMQALAAQPDYQAVMPVPVQVFRGDSWQFLTTRPETALRVALYLRAVFLSGAISSLKVKSKMSIAVGAVYYTQGKNSSGDGPAYMLSGQNLDQITRKSTSKLVFDVANPVTLPAPVLEGLRVICTGLDFISSGWTPAQARAIGQALLGGTSAQIAGKWGENGVTSRTIDRHLYRGGWGYLQHALIYFEDTLSGFSS